MENKNILDNVAILIVNDDSKKVSVIKEALVVMGVRNVVVSGDYVKALELLKEKLFNLVMVELNIAESTTTALDFILTVRKDSKNFSNMNAIPIFITANSVTKRDVELARDSGVTEFVIYPFSILYLSKLINSVLKTPREFIVAETFVGPDRRRRNDGTHIGEDRRNRQGSIADRKNPEGGAEDRRNREGGIENRRSPEGGGDDRRNREGGIENRRSPEGGVENRKNKDEEVNKS